LKKIPECFTAKSAHADNKGPVHYLWDEGIVLPVRDEDGSLLQKSIPERFSGKKIPISWVMMVVVFLLCWEWTTRKLLRLA
jgi:hypothetical protein